jgi:hypothetical protein
MNVEVFAERLFRRNANGIFENVREWPAMRLLWAHVLRPERSILAGAQAHCDLGFIARHYPGAYIAQSVPTPGEQAARERLKLSPEIMVFEFTLEVKPNHGRHIVAPGEYCVVLSIAALNADMIRRGVQIRFSGQWSDDEQEMMNNGGLFFERCRESAELA